MRKLGAVLLLGCAACSLVVRSKTKDYEGACADEEEAAKARYDDSGRPSSGPLTRSVSEIAVDCRGCADQDCVERCIGESTHQAISHECAACFADAADCGFTHCRAACSANLIDAPCLACLCNHECADDLDACGGLSLAQCGGDR